MDDSKKKDDVESAEENPVELPKIAELFKRVMTLGLGAAFMTEEHIRSQLSDLKLPKDVLNTVLQGASKSKDELMNRVGNETIRLISKIDFVKEAARFVETHKFKINAEVEVVKKTDVGSDS